MAPPGGRRAPREGQSHLGDGPGTAPPGVQHDSILVSFLQHFILKSKTRSSGRSRAGATGFSSAPKPRGSVRSVHQQHPHPLAGSLGIQSPRPLPGRQNQNLHSGTFPGDAPNQVQLKFEKHWPQVVSSDTKGSVSRLIAVFKANSHFIKKTTDPVFVPTAKVVPDILSKKISK